MKKPKMKKEVERPVYAVAEQTQRPDIDRYKVVVRAKLPNGTIEVDGLNYSIVTLCPDCPLPSCASPDALEPTINAQALRDWCAAHNKVQHLRQRPRSEASSAVVSERRRAARAAGRAAAEAARAAEEKAREERYAAKRAEERAASHRARILLREMSIMNRKMDEVETGQRCL